MNDFELYRVTISRLEKVWREAERRARLLELAPDPETDIARASGSRV